MLKFTVFCLQFVLFAFAANAHVTGIPHNEPHGSQVPVDLVGVALASAIFVAIAIAIRAYVGQRP